MNSENRLKINLKRSVKYVALSNLTIYYSWENMKKSYKTNKFKISPSTWNEEFELRDGSYSVSYIQDYFKYISKRHETVTDNLSIRAYVNRRENRITFKIKAGKNLELLTPETIKLLRSTKSKVNKDETGKKVRHLDIIEVVLIHCNVVNNNYQQDWVLYTFGPNRLFG